MSKKKILVVDDEPELIKAITIVLEESDYKVVSAKDGIEGLKVAEDEKPDLAMLDIGMAKMDGYMMIRDLKQNEGTKFIPIIILTAYVTMKDLFEVEGIKDYITKPFDNQDLLLRVSRALKK